MRRERVNLGAGSNPSWSPTTRPLSRRSHDPTFFHPYLRSLHRLKNLYRHFHSLRREDVNGDVAFFSLSPSPFSLSLSLHLFVKSGGWCSRSSIRACVSTTGTETFASCSFTGKPLFFLFFRILSWVFGIWEI